MRIAALVGVALFVGQAFSQRPNPTPGQAGVAEPVAVLNAEKGWSGGDVLWPLATSGNDDLAYYAMRAIGRLEDPGNVRRLLAIPRLANMPAVAIAQSLNGFDPAVDPELLQAVLIWLRANTFIETEKEKKIIPGPIGGIRWATAEQVHLAEEFLLRILAHTQNDKSQADVYGAAVRSLESLARLNVRVTSFDPETVTRLSRIVANTGVNDVEGTREVALAALIAARAVESDTELVGLRDPYEQVRRLATVVLGGAGGGLDEDVRLDAIQEKLGDRNGQVRYEAVKAFARRNARTTRGCAPLLDMLGDRDTNVALAAIDALGDVCKDDEDVTNRMVAEARTPVGLTWHREAHAFVSLVKRAPDRAAMAMEAFVMHPNWWVRLYAVRAAAAAGDAVRLEKLAYDVNDNVREAALGPLRKLKKGDAESAIVAALARNDVQLLRTAAILLKDSGASGDTARALVAALLRLTKEGKETSRDGRVALLEAIDVHAANPAIAIDLQPLLKDFDPIVAMKTAPIVSRLTNKPAAAEPVHVTRGWASSFADLRQCVKVNLDSGKSFTLKMDPAVAPMTVDRFLTLALRDHYYDGLTIHRVVPNFVIQGGGPGANEYAGHKEYMRDEIYARNSRGTVGLSTRGRNTADGQFYINLINNLRLDQDYTVFASVDLLDMPAVDAMQEGDVMRQFLSVRCRLGPG